MQEQQLVFIYPVYPVMNKTYTNMFNMCFAFARLLYNCCLYTSDMMGLPPGHKDLQQRMEQIKDGWEMLAA